MFAPPLPLPKVRPARWHAQALALCALLAGPTQPLRAQDAGLERWVAGLTTFYNERSDLRLPPLSAAQIQQLARGEVVVLVRREPRPGDSEQTDDRLVGFRLVEAPMREVWLAALDPDLPVAPIYHDLRLWHDEAGNSRWCVLLDLPWPLADRYWTVDLRKSTRLAADSEGRLWEHRWELSEDGAQIARRAVEAGDLPGVAVEQLEAAVYTPANRGGILTADFGAQGTLLVYHLSAVVGGYVPDALVNAIGRREIRHFLDQAAERSASIDLHYDAQHEDVFGGDGRPIARRDPH